MTEGLSRRRVGGGGGGGINSPNPSGSGFDSSNPSPSTTPLPSSKLQSSNHISQPSSSSLSNPNSGGGGTSGQSGISGGGTGNGRSKDALAGIAAGSNSSGAVEGRGKVVFDPRDMENGDEEGRVPRLTIMEEVLLLGLKDKQGYLSFWNDNISYALRGCILIELALRRRIAVVKDPSRRRLALPDRLIEVIDERQTGETILDEALKMMKSSEKYGTGGWVDLMSGETWNVMKIGYQLKQVRERLAKGLVDKGVLRTEKRNFLLFDMATHPIADTTAKEDVLRRTLSLLTARTTAIPPQALQPINVQYRTTRAVVLCCAAYAANVLENALQRLSYDSREAAFTRCDDILAEFCQWPFGAGQNVDSGPVNIGGGVGSGRKHGSSSNGGGGGMGSGQGRDQVQELIREVRKEMAQSSTGGPGDDAGEDLCFEVVATVLNVFASMDSLV